MEQTARKKAQAEFRRRIYAYVLRLIRFLTRLPNDPVVREIKPQLTRSGTSIGANYFEGIGSPSSKEFGRYLSYSLKSSNETKFWLALLRDSEILDAAVATEADELLKETKEIANILAASLRTMKAKV